MRPQRPPNIVKEMLISESKDKGFKLPDFKMYYKTKKIKTVILESTNRLMEHKDRPENNSCIYSQ